MSSYQHINGRTTLTQSKDILACNSHSSGLSAKLPEDQLLQQLRPVCLDRRFCPVPDPRLSQLHWQWDGRRVSSDSFLSVTTADTSSFSVFILKLYEVYIYFPDCWILITLLCLESETRNGEYGWVHKPEHQMFMDSFSKTLWRPTENALATRICATRGRLEGELLAFCPIYE